MASEERRLRSALYLVSLSHQTWKVRTLSSSRVRFGRRPPHNEPHVLAVPRMGVGYGS